LFIALCDRVAAQALPEDVTGASWHAVCHPDSTGAFATSVDTSRLVPLDSSALDTKGTPVPLAKQETERAYRVARIEALARDRTELIAAFDGAFPDVPIPLKNLASPDPAASCDVGETGQLPPELAQVLGRMVSVENDGTMPFFTEALARMMSGVESGTAVDDALARLDARQGYRPLSVDLGAARPILAYPQLVALVRSVVALVADRKPIAGKAAAQMQQLLAVGREGLRTAAPAAPLAPLAATADPKVPGRSWLSRPRSTLEILQRVLLDGDPSFDVGLSPPPYVVARDRRGYAAVPLVGGAVPPPFVDQDGDDLPDIDPLGRFVGAGGQPIASPFFSPDAADGVRDSAGRAVGTATPFLYQYVDVGQTFLAKFEDDLRPLLDPDPAHGREAVMGLAAGAYVLFGDRDASATATRAYPPDPESPNPSTPVVLPYRALHPDTSPLVDLVYALGVMMADPVIDDVLQLARTLMTEHPVEMARLAGLALKIKAIADAHPEAHIPAGSTIWDELLDDLATISHVQDGLGGGGILEDLLLAFTQDATVNLQQTFAAYVQYRDPLTYNHHSTSGGLGNALNGPAWNLASNGVDPLHVAVDRSQPDAGDNRSALQRFMQLLHDANGLDVCTKAGAVAHVQFRLGALGTKAFDYPTDPLSGIACTLVGAPAPPNPMPACGILRIRNIDALLLDVALDRARFDIRDPCLTALMNSPLTNLVGGVDPFLEAQSGIAGFDTHPTVQGVARLVYFDTPHDADPDDTNPATMTTYDFLKDVIDPVPSMVCAPAPFTDSDGTLVALRSCSTFADTLRGRDPGFLFPVEQLDFVPNVRPLAAAFDDHGQPLLFVTLFDTLHRHWGSEQQPPDLCDPTQPPTSARWCSRDGVVRYEPLLADILVNTDVLQTLHDVVGVIAGTTITHCDAQDPATHACTKTSLRTGVQVLAQAVRVMVDPAHNQGLTDRHGVMTSPRNDGTSNPQVTPMYLFVDALKAIDAAFAKWATLRPGDDRQPAWRAARSQFVDQFFGVGGSGAQSAWANQAVPAIVPALIDVLEEQILAQCPDRSSRAVCTWWSQTMPQNLADVVGGPAFASILDLVDAIRADGAGRGQLEQLLLYLLGPSSANDARAATMTASVDLVQLLGDDTNLVPLYHAAADAFGARVTAPDGTTARRGLVDAAIELLAGIFTAAYDPHGNEVCSQEIDPNGALADVLSYLVTPAGVSGRSPVEVLIDAAADVNRAHPQQTAKLAGADYANIAKEVREFCLDPASGLEQVYALVRQATLPQ
jgi:hypothetical protein